MKSAMPTSPGQKAHRLLCPLRAATLPHSVRDRDGGVVEQGIEQNARRDHVHDAELNEAVKIRPRDSVSSRICVTSVMPQATSARRHEAAEIAARER